MTIIWTKGKTIKQIVRAIEAALKRTYRCSWRSDCLHSVSGLSTEETVCWMEQIPVGGTLYRWQVDKGNSVDAFGFNGTTYFG